MTLSLDNEKSLSSYFKRINKENAIKNDKKEISKNNNGNGTKYVKNALITQVAIKYMCFCFKVYLILNTLEIRLYVIANSKNNKIIFAATIKDSFGVLIAFQILFNMFMFVHLHN